MSTYLKNINVNILQTKNVNIPSNNNNQLSVPVKVHFNKEFNPVFNCDSVNEYVSTSNSDIDIQKRIRDVNIPQNVNDNQHKNVNIPPVNVDIRSSQTNKYNYNPSSIYQYIPVKRKLTLKIDDGNDNSSRSVVIHRTLWKIMFDIKKYSMERNPQYTYDRQTIKYMGEVLSNKDITFEEMNSKSEMTFDIVIEKLIL